MRRNRLQTICLDCQKCLQPVRLLCFVVVRAAVKPPILKEARFYAFARSLPGRKYKYLLLGYATYPPKNIQRRTIKAKTLRFNRNKNRDLSMTVSLLLKMTLTEYLYFISMSLKWQTEIALCIDIHNGCGMIFIQITSTNLWV